MLSSLRVYQIYIPELGTYVKFKVLSPEIVEEFVSSSENLNREDYIKRVLDNVIFNMKTEVISSLREMSRETGKDTLEALFNGCVMLNPGLDIDSWVRFTYQGIEKPETSEEEEEVEAEATVKTTKKIPAPKKISKTRFMNLDKYLKERVVGQDEAIESLVGALKRSQAGLNDEQRPLGVFMFAGSSGVGKTLLARELHSYLFGDKYEMVRIDCGEFQHKHENQKLTGCFTPDSLVWMGDGTCKEIQSVEVGDKIISHTGNIREVIDTYEYDTFESLIEIKVAGSPYPITCTPSHEFWSIQSTHRPDVSERQQRRIWEEDCLKENLDWHSAKTFKKGDWLAIPRPKISVANATFDLAQFIPIIGGHSKYKVDDSFVWAYDSIKVNRFIPVDEKFARLAGYYVSEGGSSKSKKSFNFTMHTDELENIHEIKKLVTEIFGLSNANIVDRTKNNSYRIFFFSRVVSNFMSTLFGDHTHRKKLPEEFLHASDAVKAELLETAIIGDGCNKIAGKIDYSTTSKDLYSGLLSIVRSLGFSPYSAIETPKEPQFSKRYRIYITGDQLVRYNAMVNESSAALISPSYGREIRNMRSDDEYAYHKVLEVKEVPYSGKVHDLSVGEETSYCINGFAVHNSPPGFVGYDDGGALTNQIEEHPNTVVLLDEVEKAHPDIWKTFLRVFDEGIITNNKGNPVSFRNAVIIMTTNLGNKKVVDNLTGKGVGFGARTSILQNIGIAPPRDQVVRVTLDAIKEAFEPEFLNRIDKTIVFNHLTKSNFQSIAEMELMLVDDKLGRRGNSLKWDDATVDALITFGVDSVKGARGMAQVRRDKIEDPLAELILNGRITRGTIFELSYANDTFDISVRKPTKRVKAKTI